MIFATANRHKLEEVQAIMPEGITLQTPADYGITEDIPENESTLEGNALAKARYVYLATGEDCFADDTGLEVDALGGEPGVRSARYAQGAGHDSRANMELLLKNLSGGNNRRARFRTVIALILKGKEHLFEGIVEGSIRHEGSGSEGFGYDPIFEPTGYTTTFAEMPLEEKNLISHRSICTRKLINFLTHRAENGL